ncbi:class II histone deacetylase [Paracoccus laeviglucosivorans]|uniref:Acetoin utilization deacetylase AcuC n=1 Tax=Paracoccus laeviglucosivorans TaxID=1197861 RepID=A0A521ABI7_9RHOB|nr:class II histone deacetylase [Paracoccus laeviglucosivorans]SMO32184.1 Acetoin utilization deacetylase AcuC [Paracoccus laeviglucosivorans]
MATGFLHDELTLWHGGGDYALTLPVGGFVQPGAGMPESPESKRRLVNLMQVSGLMAELRLTSAPPATRDDLLRVHPARYLDRFKAASDAGGGELGHHAPFLRGGYEIAALSAGLAKAAVGAVLRGDLTSAYALSRPPGHHCLPDDPNGFCLLANIAIAIHAARAAGLAQRFAVVDWDVHHGNGTEAIFLDDPDVLTVSLHQDRNYPLDTGAASTRGAAGSNINIPLPPGCGDASYTETLERIVIPALTRHRPEIIIVACGFDASAMDPLGRMLVSAAGFGAMTGQLQQAAADLCKGRLVLVHEGGYSEAYVPFCGHAAIARLAGSGIDVPDPLAQTIATRQPDARWVNNVSAHLRELAEFFEV